FVSNAFLPDYVIAQSRPDLVGAALPALNIGQLPAAFFLLGLAGPLVTGAWAYAATALASLAALIGMVTSHGVGIVVFAGLLGFTNALTLTLALALPSMLSAPDDVHRTSAGMFTISYSCAMLLSIVGGWLWDLTAMPVASFAPVALCAIVIVALASTVKNARQWCAKLGGCFEVGQAHCRVDVCRFACSAGPRRNFSGSSRPPDHSLCTGRQHRHARPHP